MKTEQVIYEIESKLATDSLIRLMMLKRFIIRKMKYNPGLNSILNSYISVVERKILVIKRQKVVFKFYYRVIDKRLIRKQIKEQQKLLDRINSDPGVFKL